MKRNHFLVLSSGAVAAATIPIKAWAAESDIALHTATGTISGTLSLPNAAKGVPIVLIIAGSGPTDRDGNNPLIPGKNDAYKLLAAGLAGRGIASVRYDKRGIGASAKAMTSESSLRFTTYVDDAKGWIDLLRRDPRFSKVVVAGHSEGALIGTIAAQRPGVAGFASLEGAGRPAAAILRAQLKPQFPPALYAEADAAITQLQNGKLYTAGLPDSLNALFRPSVQPYLISWFKYDPAVEIGKVRAPVIIVQGTADLQVTMVDAQALQSGNPRAKLVVVEGMNHVLKHAPNTSTQAAILAGYSDPALPVDPKVTDAVASLV
ncbi:MAG TPA: alpha/beta fold hydrolase [Candidatus Rubrimentiphilum sp.]|nr:alpha/beta fold hydrolase [Candidatus Rubrimentiphilum sp.]